MAMRRLPVRPVLLNRRAVLAGGVAVGTAAALAACGNPEPPVDENGRVRLRLVVDGPATVDLGGFYQALATGLYEARDLNVQLVRPGFGQDVPRALATGRAELGLVDDGFIPLRLVEEGAPVKAVAAFFQTSPRALVRHAPATSGEAAPPPPSALQVANADRDTLWPWLQARLDYPDDLIADYDLDAFLADPRAVMLGHVAREPVQIAATEGPATTARLLAEDGFASYGDLLLAPTAFARDNEAALRAFIAASIEGWKDYINGDPEPAHALIRKALRGRGDQTLGAAHDALRAAAIVTGGDSASGIGTMSEAHWQAFFDSAVEAGLAQPELAWRDAWTPLYLPT
ncbi:ABC transporter substrate-binding protein [Brevundimonas sp. A19_0]|uniref:ABC transporter substrate-binding protein n=1 Tax=Brevundimonas sp. A19_0 TaxID=2821087 RepID=UPI001ADD0D96|nr:ABC transporter substrate-binding protein [Brevundimonas sp. A19_0]MBO9501075.1 ABC transporter substrate-binding protein [Brevundimonas sp. A19_0]